MRGVVVPAKEESLASIEKWFDDRTTEELLPNCLVAKVSRIPCLSCVLTLCPGPKLLMNRVLMRSFLIPQIQDEVFELTHSHDYHKLSKSEKQLERVLVMVNVLLANESEAPESVADILSLVKKLADSDTEKPDSTT